MMDMHLFITIHLLLKFPIEQIVDVWLLCAKLRATLN